MKRRTYPYIPHTAEDVTKMCAEVGVASIEALMGAFPEALRLDAPLVLPRALSEQELKEHLAWVSEKNTASRHASFLGAGSYNHYIPSVVDQMLLRGELFTAYTPYQPELSQGTLQAAFEFQTMICQLTGMEASNASLYDGASAAAEAVLMARRITKKKKVVLSSALHPEYRDTVVTYLGATPGDVSEISYCKETGSTLVAEVEQALSGETACVVVQSPNFFGVVEDLKPLAQAVHRSGALLVVVTTEALSLALLRPPGELGADISVGEGQSFGSPVSFGGPYLGFLATRSGFIRQMPGRIVGETVDRDGNRAWCLTLATREQHIRRESATSNICTNQGLAALACTVYLSTLGKTGLMDLALLNLQKAKYLRDSLTSIKGVSAAFTSHVFNEFVIKVETDAEALLGGLAEEGVLGGLHLGRFYTELKDYLLVAATETNSKEDIDRLKGLVAGLV